jgi:cytoskeletal protein RodZ
MEVIMKQFNKKFILIIMLTGIFLLTGCDKVKLNTYNASQEDSDTEVTITPEENNTDAADKEAVTSDTQALTTTEDQANPSDSTPTPLAIQPAANTELQVYNVNADTSDIEPVTALIPDGNDITPQLIVDTVVESLADQSIVIGIDSVTTKDDAIIVSFIKDKAPYSNLGSGYEQAILDAIAQSLIDNLSDYSKVIYRIEGNAYTSGVFEYGIDEPYLEEN